MLSSHDVEVLSQVYKCPIGLYGMFDPVIIDECKHVFEQDELQTHAENSTECPLCKKDFIPGNVKPAIDLKDAIQEILKKNPKVWHEIGWTPKIVIKAIQEKRLPPPEIFKEILHKSEHPSGVFLGYQVLSYLRNNAVKLLQGSITTNLSLAEIINVLPPLIEYFATVEIFYHRAIWHFYAGNEESARADYKQFTRQMEVEGYLADRRVFLLRSFFSYNLKKVVPFFIKEMLHTLCERYPLEPALGSLYFQLAEQEYINNFYNKLLLMEQGESFDKTMLLKIYEELQGFYFKSLEFGFDPCLVLRKLAEARLKIGNYSGDTEEARLNAVENEFKSVSSRYAKYKAIDIEISKIHFLPAEQREQAFTELFERNRSDREFVLQYARYIASYLSSKQSKVVLYVAYRQHFSTDEFVNLDWYHAENSERFTLEELQECRRSADRYSQQFGHVLLPRLASYCQNTQVKKTISVQIAEKRDAIIEEKHQNEMQRLRSLPTNEFAEALKNYGQPLISNMMLDPIIINECGHIIEQDSLEGGSSLSAKCPCCQVSFMVADVRPAIVQKKQVSEILNSSLKVEGAQELWLMAAWTGDLLVQKLWEGVIIPEELFGKILRLPDYQEEDLLVGNQAILTLQNEIEEVLECSRRSFIDSQRACKAIKILADILETVQKFPNTKCYIYFESAIYRAYLDDKINAVADYKKYLVSNPTLQEKLAALDKFVKSTLFSINIYQEIPSFVAQMVEDIYKALGKRDKELKSNPDLPGYSSLQDLSQFKIALGHICYHLAEQQYRHYHIMEKEFAVVDVSPQLRFFYHKSFSWCQDNRPIQTVSFAKYSELRLRNWSDIIKNNPTTCVEIISAQLCKLAPGQVEEAKEQAIEHQVVKAMTLAKEHRKQAYIEIYDANKSKAKFILTYAKLIANFLFENLETEADGKKVLECLNAFRRYIPNDFFANLTRYRVQKRLKHSFTLQELQAWQKDLAAHTEYLLLSPNEEDKKGITREIAEVAAEERKIQQMLVAKRSHDAKLSHQEFMMQLSSGGQPHVAQDARLEHKKKRKRDDDKDCGPEASSVAALRRVGMNAANSSRRSGLSSSVAEPSSSSMDTSHDHGPCSSSPSSSSMT
jgi:hypothetical protein